MRLRVVIQALYFCLNQFLASYQFNFLAVRVQTNITSSLFAGFSSLLSASFWPAAHWLSYILASRWIHLVLQCVLLAMSSRVGTCARILYSSQLCALDLIHLLQVSVKTGLSIVPVPWASIYGLTHFLAPCQTHFATERFAAELNSLKM